MTEAEQQQLSAPFDSDMTIAAPRFDAAEAQEAQPVVPLADVRQRPRTWPLLLLSALLGGAVSICALYLYQRPPARTSDAHTATQLPAAQTQTNAPVANETAQAEAPPPVAARTQAPAATDAAEHSAVAVAAPAGEELKMTKRERKRAESAMKDTNQAERDAERKMRAQHAERVAVHHDAARQNGPAPDERAPRETRPRTVTQKPHTPPRNVDRIRDIFEGTPPPQYRER
jgi:hypothetical protein